MLINPQKPIQKLKLFIILNAQHTSPITQCRCAMFEIQIGNTFQMATSQGFLTLLAH